MAKAELADFETVPIPQSTVIDAIEFLDPNIEAVKRRQSFRVISGD